MTDTDKQKLLAKIEEFARDTLATKHLANLLKLKSLDEFDINPFLTKYLSRFLTGKDDAKSIARTLVYARILGTSINTSFGMNFQKFCTQILGATGAIVSGTDIEFTDQIDGRYKYCQLKAGPNTINYDDIVTIRDHFKKMRNVGRQNSRLLGADDLIIGVMYGSSDKLNSFYKVLSEDFPIFVGEEFWYRFTGDMNFYVDMVERFSVAALQTDASEHIESVINELSIEVQRELLDKELKKNI
jgi:hypothetical protein